jgi:hypothetical protein
MYGGFRDDVCVEAVAEIDGVDVVTTSKGDTKLACALGCGVAGKPEQVAFVHDESGRIVSLSIGGRANNLVIQLGNVAYAPFQIAIHDGEEDLEEQIDGVYQHGQQIEPCFSRHHENRGAPRRSSVKCCGARCQCR